MSQLVVLAAVFLGTVGVLIGAYLFINRRALTAADTALERLRDTQQAPTTMRSILRDVNVSDLPVLDRILAGRGITAVIAEQMQNAGLTDTPASFMLRAAVVMAVCFVLGTFWGGLLVGMPGLVVGLVLPIMWLKYRQRKRLSEFQAQLPDAIDMLVSAMKAGYSFQAAMRFIGEEVRSPLGPEFMRFYEEQRLGMEVRIALLALQARIASVDLKMFVTAVLIQRETGGNLGEVLEKISGLMRERAAIKGEIETLTAESKLSARILSALPLVVFTAVNLLNPGFMKPMLATNGGVMMFVLAAGMVILGYYSMMKIADIDI
jgi:tight adherence protein B